MLTEERLDFQGFTEKRPGLPRPTSLHFRIVWIPDKIHPNTGFPRVHRRNTYRGVNLKSPKMPDFWRKMMNEKSGIPNPSIGGM